MWTDRNVPTNIINELQNRPRYDIIGERYGNTLSDDMFSIKNPRVENKHTPESFDYFNQQRVESPEVMSAGQATGYAPLPTLNFSSVVGNAMPTDFRDRGVSRKVNFSGDGKDWELYRDWSNIDDILEFPELYSQDEINWADSQRRANEAAQRVRDLSTEGIREDMGYQRSGDYRESPEWISRRNSDYDDYLEALVNYQDMSPATAIQLAKMGVNRPEENDINQVSEGDPLNRVLDAYKIALELGYLK